MDHTIFRKDAATLNKRVWRLIAKESSCALYPSMQIYKDHSCTPIIGSLNKEKEFGLLTRCQTHHYHPFFFLILDNSIFSGA